MDQRAEPGSIIVGDFHLMTSHGFIMLRHIPRKHKWAIEMAARRDDGWFDMRTRVGKIAVLQCKRLARWQRRRRDKAGW